LPLALRRRTNIANNGSEPDSDELTFLQNWTCDLQFSTVVISQGLGLQASVLFEPTSKCLPESHVQQLLRNIEHYASNKDPELFRIIKRLMDKWFSFFWAQRWVDHSQGKLPVPVPNERPGKVCRCSFEPKRTLSHFQPLCTRALSLLHTLPRTGFADTRNRISSCVQFLLDMFDDPNFCFKETGDYSIRHFQAYLHYWANKLRIPDQGPPRPDMPEEYISGKLTVRNGTICLSAKEKTIPREMHWIWRWIVLFSALQRQRGSWELIHER
jgi:hypothetical protein